MINKKGFTIVEVLIVCSIIFLFSFGGLYFYKQNTYKNFINNDIMQIKSDIYKIYTDSISGKSSNDFEENINYGIYFSVGSNNYIVYKDNNLNNRYNSGEDIEIIYLKNSNISNLSSGSYFDLLYKNNKDIYINSIKLNSKNSFYSITLNNSDYQKVLSINPYNFLNN